MKSPTSPDHYIYSGNPYRLDPPRGLSDYDENPDATPVAEKPDVEVYLGPEKTTPEIYDILREMRKHHTVISVHLDLYGIPESVIDEYQGIPPKFYEELDEKRKTILDLCPTPPLRQLLIFRGHRKIFDWHS